MDMRCTELTYYCPNCGEGRTYWAWGEYGGICPKCGHVFAFNEWRAELVLYGVLGKAEVYVFK